MFSKNKKVLTQFKKKMAASTRRKRMLSNNHKKVLWRQRTYVLTALTEQ